MIERIKLWFKRLRCNHDFETISNFYGDYIDIVNGYTNPSDLIFRSRVRCKKCGYVTLSPFLDKNCTVVNDGHCE